MGLHVKDSQRSHDDSCENRKQMQRMRAERLHLEEMELYEKDRQKPNAEEGGVNYLAYTPELPSYYVDTFMQGIQDHVESVSMIQELRKAKLALEEKEFL